jgi:S-adenosylmethionine synthetase
MARPDLPITIGRLAGPLIDRSPMEIVERKGLGHPDSISDALAEVFSIALCRFHRERFGLILHHNVDKVLLRGGSARPAFGGGEVIEPIEIFLAGRATAAFEGIEVPTVELAFETAHAWFAQHFHALDAERHVRIRPLVRPGSQDLIDLYLRRQRTGVVLANDTSCGVGFAPLSELETVVLEIEQELNSPTTRAGHPEIGQDIKVMAVRRGQSVHLTVACAVIDRFLRNAAEYRQAKSAVADMARSVAARHTAKSLEVVVNAADDLEAGSVYLTVTGTSAEAGEDGEAGRGNRVNGLITPFRPMTMESAAGKNPVPHVGKLYNLCASLVAQHLVTEIPEIAAVQCFMVSEIGRPIDQPQIIDVRVEPAEGRHLNTLRRPIQAVVSSQLEAIPQLAAKLLDGDIVLDRWPLARG